MSASRDSTLFPSVPDAVTKLSDVAVPAGHANEICGPDGQVRDVWRRFTTSAPTLDVETLRSASARTSRQMREHGVTYNLYDAPGGSAHPWSLDVLPHIVTAEEWQALDGGLRQAARLLDELAADIYGERRLLAEGHIPSALVYGHRGFLRRAVGAKPTGHRFVHLAAFDLARGPDDRWQLVDARVQAPSGLGYALENRATIARLFPDAFRELGVRPLGPCADLVLNALAADATSDAPLRAVILTPGPYSETYFEHLSLARQLGLTLVHGGDLTVRQGRVFLMTVDGLRPVDAIWRRVDDDFCDPLELRPDSTLGVAGLAQAWRSGGVTVANGFGLGVLESPALLSYLPACARVLLGEPLSLQVVPTIWRGAWAGAPELDRLDKFVIKPALSSMDMEPVFGQKLTAAERTDWANRLVAHPTAYALQAFMPVSHAPIWRTDRLDTAPLLMRAFVVANGHGDYRVLPAALTRVAMDDQLNVSARRGGASKDTWVLGEQAQESAGASAPRHILPPLHTGTRTVTSRAAEHLFWLGRYGERTERAARVSRTILTRLTEGGALSPRLVASMKRLALEEGLLAIEEPKRPASKPMELTSAGFMKELCRGVFDRTTARGVAFGVGATVRVASTIRERLSHDHWRLLTRTVGRVAPARAPLGADATLETLDDVILSLVAAGGLEMAHMTRDDGWRFLSLGRHIERLTGVATALLSVIREGGTDDPATLDWILDVSDSLITYRARYRRLPEWPAVVDLLLYDERNPRAALFQVEKLASHTRRLPGRALADDVGALDALGAVVPSGPADAEETLTACAEAAERLSDAIALQYFSHVYDAPHATVNA